MIGSGNKGSILTFNASVSNKKIFTTINQPYQIMPSTRNYLTDASIGSYPKDIVSKSLLIHMNYITKPFSDDAIESNSRVRFGFRQYVKLLKRLNTNEVLIHMPNTINEFKNLLQGLKVIYDEFITNDVNVNLEIASWSKDLLEHFGVINGEDNDNVSPKDAVIMFIDAIIKACNTFKTNKFRIVLDTAHLHAIGCTVENQIELFTHYRGLMKYAHLNGNEKPQFVSDSHVPIWHSRNKIKQSEELSKFIATTGLICIAEVTKEGGSYEKWNEYSAKYGFNLVEYNESYSM